MNEDTHSDDQAETTALDTIQQGLQHSTSRRTVLSRTAQLGVGTAALSALGSGGVAAGGGSEDDVETTATVTFQNQTSAGNTLTVDSVTLSEGGFVAVHTTELLAGSLFASVIGVSDTLVRATTKTSKSLCSM